MGHRCAIPTCKTTTTEIAHIEPWEKARTHRFENLIALCPNCQTRFARGEIERLSMLPVPQVSARAFGGDGQADLYITTSRYGLADDEQPSAGALFWVRPGISGSPVHSFAG